MGEGEKRDGELDKDSRKRLEKLEAEWEKPPAPHSIGGLSAADLRLLLEHFQPLQDLMRRIVTDVGERVPVAMPPRRAATALPASVAPCAEGLDVDSKAESPGELANTHRDLAQAQFERQQALNQCGQLKDECEKALQDLSECNNAVKALQEENKNKKQTIKKLEKQLQQAQKELRDCEASHPSTAELTLLRADPELTRHMGLAILPADDTQALIQMVAVLAQRDNLERLWSTLKDRCEADKRPVSTDELTLLKAALAWHNHNWPTRPYSLIEAMPDSGYDFERHLRSRHNTRGETVAALRLPGIADGGGHILCKALVHTR